MVYGLGSSQKLKPKSFLSPNDEFTELRVRKVGVLIDRVGGSGQMNSFYTVQQQPQLRGLSNHYQHSNVSQTQRIFVPSKNDQDDASNPWTIVICILFVLLMCWCSKPNIPDRRFRKDRRYWMEQRDAKIKRSLHIRQVVSADESGNLQLGEIDDDDEEAADAASRVSSIIEDENEVACCSICLEPYRVGDKVAWTARPPDSDQEEECLHVFHYECILAWLENPKNNDCPSCRAKVMLDDDNVGTKSNKSGEAGDDDDDDDDHGSANSSAFVIMHGLISRARRASYNLIGKSVSVDSDGDAPLTSLSEPSPLRKAHTFGGGGLFKRQSLLRRRSRSVSVSEHSLNAEDEDDIQMIFPSSTKLVESVPPGPTSLRRVASAGPSTPLRSGSVGRREQSQRQTDRIIREEETNMNNGIPALTFTESQDLTELSESSSDLLLGGTFSSGTGGGHFPMLRQRSSSVRTSIYEKCELLVVDDLNHVESEEDGLRNPIAMRNSVSWARDIYDGEEEGEEEPTNRTEEDEIIRRVT